ncbi:YcjF family protein [Roseovarius salis]|uniref:YcjF family protein n=1 Tax=Roseovarius salis TaxID=3376063 RepID=UPI0037C6FB32
MTNGPILIDLDETEPAEGPDTAPPIPDDGAAAPDGRAMQAAALLASHRPSRLARWAWGLTAILLAAMVSVTVWDFLAGMLSRSAPLGYAVLAIVGALLMLLTVLAVREFAALSRLKRLDTLHRMAEAALSEADLAKARRVTGGLDSLYAGREEARLGRDRLRSTAPDQFDAADLLGLAEAEILSPLDAAAAQEVEAAARQVAAVTALVPLTAADVVVALTANLRMIRRIAEIYGGRSGIVGGWRLARAVLTHVVATGAVAVGDDMLGSVAGGGVISKLSRRFGEGIVNGALTARVGVAAMEVCRPMPFVRRRRPSVSRLVRRALTGLFGQG